ncbi:methyltransferase domain-containing protein [Caulobacter segnis]|uniref:methyltransferase domain-containing protein n=1 Tax=Caulobacter segnis TaxID=88688 RepID=UPI00240EB1B9|nr:methyltransferase domain-containing protein [Caulobacter segnis]MDG2522270.1 methyltransferase domain-containing protein [Caulobacter segnis]
MPSWDPALYERYKRYRDRPALDLMLQIPRGGDLGEIWDLGCGTGEHAALLARRYRAAKVHGLDSSPHMIAECRKRTEAVDWVLGDLNSFEASADLIFTNAALQWAPDHGTLFLRLVKLLNPGGVFACQMPLAYESVHHGILRRTAAKGPWAEVLKDADAIRRMPTAAEYHDWLAPLCDSVDIWSTRYLHVLEGEDAVVDWMSGTALRPYFDVLGEGALKDAFLDAFRVNIASAFPMRADGTTLFPFERLFIVAQRAP